VRFLYICFLKVIIFPELLYEPPVEVIVLLSVFYGLISILAVLGNSLVIWIVATTRQMQTITNFFIANLAFADVIIGMFAIPFEVSQCEPKFIDWKF
jgi:leucokinin receptor